jgi:ribosome-binding protein aMBF1 (putative translation factor)
MTTTHVVVYSHREICLYLFRFRVKNKIDINLPLIHIITTVHFVIIMSSNNQRNRYSTPEREAPDCQDWTPVTMSKTRPASTVSSYKDAAAAARPTLASMAATKNSASAVVAATTSASKGAGNDTDMAKKTKYIVKATSDAVRTARCEKKLTQKELAQKCNMDVSIIAEIERGGTCVYNANHVNKIQSVLGVKIPRA